MRSSVARRCIMCVITLSSCGLCWATICLHLHTHRQTHTRHPHTHTHIQHFPLKTLQRAKFTADSASTVRYRPCVCSVQDLSHWQSSKTGRGPLEEGWKDDHKPIMCSYKRVQCSFEVYGFQTRTEEFVHRVRQLDFPACLFPFADVKESLIKM